MAYDKKTKDEQLAAEPKKFVVVLEKDHVDSGIEYAANTELEVDEPTCKFILDNEIGKLKS